MFGSPGAGNGTTGSTIYMFDTTNWYDTDYINFKVFMIIN
jgi:hypothetical protein